MSYFKKTMLTDAYGFGVEFTPMDEMRVVTPTRLIGATFQGGTVDTNFWTVTNAAGGTTTQANGQVTLLTNTTANGSTILQTVHTARYLGGASNRFRAQIRHEDTGTVNNTRRWGMFNGTNGAYFKLAGTTLSACTIKGGVETSVASTSWNGSTTVPTLTNYTTYEIYITNSKCYFVMAGVLMHTATFATTTWTDTTVLPVRCDNINTGGSVTNVTMEVRVATVYRLGEQATLPVYKYQSGAGTVTCKLGAGTLHRLVITDGANGSTVTVYDNTAGSGAIIASISTGNITAPNSVEFNCPFSTGLTIVVVNAVNVTVIYE